MDHLTMRSGATHRNRADSINRLPPPDGVQIATVVAAAFDIAPADLWAPTRGCAGTALARQTAMYLARVALGMTLSRAGGLFGRDRTTAAYACSRIEDLRDHPPFDVWLSVLEAVVQERTRSRAKPVAAQ